MHRLNSCERVISQRSQLHVEEYNSNAQHSLSVATSALQLGNGVESSSNFDHDILQLELDSDSSSNLSVKFQSISSSSCCGKKNKLSA